MTAPQTDHPVIIIGGPTASGKSGLALAAADALLDERGLEAVIINADSQQVYADLQILSARPDADELARAEHRLYGVLGADEACDAQRWREMVIPEIRDVHAQGKIPVLVGGTGMYINALLIGFHDIPDVPQDIRDKALARQAELGNPAFHAELAARDPVMGDRLNENDTQRLIRAWEVYEATGKSLSAYQSGPTSGPPPGMAFYCFFLVPPREVLYDKINKRWDEMVGLGVVDEVRKLDETFDQLGNERADMPLTRAHGVPPLRSYLHGETTLDDAGDQIKQQTRNYAKRQMTWIRHQMGQERLQDRSNGAVKCSTVIEQADPARIIGQPELKSALSAFASIAKTA